MIREKAEIERERYRHRKTQKGVVKIGPQTDRHRDNDRQIDREREREGKMKTQRNNLQV